MKTSNELKQTAKDTFRLKTFLGSWEMILVYILILINLILVVFKTELYFTPGTITSIIQSSLDLSFMVMGMIFVLMLGDIDVSIASIMIAGAMTFGLVYEAGLGTFAAIVCCLLTGAVCGLFNGFLVAVVKMPAVIVTISTSMLYRGSVQIILGVNSLKNFPAWMGKLGWGNFLGIPIILWCFILATVLFGFILQKTKFGRSLYIIGNNRTAAIYSGLPVTRIKMTVFTIMGIMAGVSAVFFIGRFGGVSSTMATGYELDVIAITVLGGVSSNGGKGKVYGPFISALLMEFLFYALGLFGVEANTRKIITGLVLIAAIMVPHINSRNPAILKLYQIFFCSNSREIAGLKLALKKELAECDELIRQLRRDSSLDPDKKQAKIAAIQEKMQEAGKKTQSAVAHVRKDMEQLKKSGKTTA